MNSCCSSVFGSLLNLENFGVSFGHSSSGSRRNDGPVHHLLEGERSTSVVSLVASSATFSFVEIHHQADTPTNSSISSTRFATNILKQVALDCSQHNTVCESVQKWLEEILMSSSLVNVVARRLPITAACSSSRGIDIGRRGATSFCHNKCSPHAIHKLIS